MRAHAGESDQHAPGDPGARPCASAQICVHLRGIGDPFRRSGKRGLDVQWEWTSWAMWCGANRSSLASRCATLAFLLVDDAGSALAQICSAAVGSGGFYYQCKVGPCMSVHVCHAMCLRFTCACAFACIDACVGVIDGGVGFEIVCSPGLGWARGARMMPSLMIVLAKLESSHLWILVAWESGRSYRWELLHKCVR